MADDFDWFLAAALSPAPRLPDRQFVAGVQVRILLEERLSQERRRAAASLLTQLLALLGVTAAAWRIGGAAPVANLFARTPWAGLLILLIAFGFVVAMFSSLGRSPRCGRQIGAMRH